MMEGAIRSALSGGGGMTAAQASAYARAASLHASSPAYAATSLRSGAGIKYKVGEVLALTSRLNDIACAPPAMADGAGGGGDSGSGAGGGPGSTPGTPGGGLLGTDFMTRLLLTSARVAGVAGATVGSGSITAVNPRMPLAAMIAGGGGGGGGKGYPSPAQALSSSSTGAALGIGSGSAGALLWALSRVALLNIVLRWGCFSDACAAVLLLVGEEHKEEATEACRELTKEAEELMTSAASDKTKDAFGRHFIRWAKTMAGRL